METLLFIVAISLTFLALGLAQGKGEDLVKVALKQSVHIWGTTYHPNSKGVTMPRSHAHALGAKIIEDPQPTATQSEPETKDNPETQENPESQSKTDSGKEPEGEGQQDSDPDPDVLPDDFPGRDVLAKNGIDTIAKVLEIPDLTAFNGIGKKTAEDILAAVETATQSEPETE